MLASLNALRAASTKTQYSTKHSKRGVTRLYCTKTATDPAQVGPPPNVDSTATVANQFAVDGTYLISVHACRRIFR